jgi:hypothetical protein
MKKLLQVTLQISYIIIQVHALAYNMHDCF